MHTETSGPGPDFRDLLAEVDRAFEVTGAGTPAWPAPRPFEASPAEEEYSRCLDPGKYRILGARVEAWVVALAARALAVAHDVPLPAEAWDGAARSPADLHRVRRVDPTRTGGMSLLLATTLVDGEPFGLDIGLVRAGRPPVLVGSLPGCGCDACDDGSDHLLEELDGWFVTVVRGGVLHVRAGARHLTRTAQGWQGQGEDLSEAWLATPSAAPAGARQWRGEPWL